ASFTLRNFAITASAGANGSITPAGTTNVNCGGSQTYTITANSCYQIADVLVNGVSVGAVSSYTFNNVTAASTISASFTQTSYNIIASAGDNGNITPAGATNVNCGGSQTYTITPNSCYQIADVLVNGVSVGAVSSYTFNNVTAANTISVLFSPITYAVTASSGENGSISPSGVTDVSCGGSQTYIITPNSCYQIADVLVNGVSVGALSSYTFHNIQGLQSISVSFLQTTYNITASSGANGMINPLGNSNITCGSNQSYAIVADPGYNIQDVVVDGVSQGAITNYSFDNVISDHSISAVFSTGSFTITASAGEHGNITPSGAVGVSTGSSQSFGITANSCYQIADVLVDGISVGAVSSYTFDNVIAPHTISASFTPIVYEISSSASGSGIISPEGATGVMCGGSQVYTITPDLCYKIEEVFVDGISVGAVSTFTFENITEAHTINASFVRSDYAITATAATGGSISPEGLTNIDCGDELDYFVSPDEGFVILDVLVDGVSVGAVTSYNFEDVSASHTIHAVFAPVDAFVINATATPNGTITPSGAVSVLSGGSQTFTIAANICYQIADVEIDGISQGVLSTYTFTNVTAPHTIHAEFLQLSYIINASAGNNGTISSPGTSIVGCGSSQTYNFTPNSCYQVADVLVDGLSVGPVSSYTFDNVSAAHTISVTFSQVNYNITANPGANGMITPAGSIAVNCGGSQTYNITPNAGYYIADVLVDGISVGAVSVYTFNNVTSVHTISAVFNIIVYTINAGAGANGSITPAGSIQVNAGSSQSFAITPASCYLVSDVLVDGVSVGAVSSYTFSNLSAPHTISASFTQSSYVVTATAGANGNITPAGATNILCGGSQTYTITPDACYQIADVLVDGISVGAVSSYSFNNIIAAHTISVSFTPISYSITAVAGANGSVTPSGVSTIACGNSTTYLIAANVGYNIQDVIVDGVSLGALSSYTFSNINTSHSISAVFSSGAFIIAATSGGDGSISPSGDVGVTAGANQTFSITPNSCSQISDVVVDGLSIGAVTTYTFNNITSSHSIKANFTLLSYNITASAGANGSISAPGISTLACGSSQTYTFTPNSCYQVADVLVDGVSAGAVSAYTFSNVTAPHTISVTFVQSTYNITAGAGANGAITPVGISSVICDGSQVYSIIPNSGFNIQDVLVDGISVGAVSSYTFNNVTSNHTIQASFSAVSSFTINATAGANGSISPSGLVGALNGSSQTFTITANSCYQIADVLVDGVSAGAVSSYTFNNVTANHTISVSFTQTGYNIISNAGANGMITPSGNTNIACGSNQTYTISANSCYQIADVLVDGVSVGAVSSYTFNNVTA
ncbi:MAG TPA: hypothetical protein PLY34_13790, partial [Ferruginibacter sp.]|nr:hypothetical protein [Ferruginibacter sp.]